MSFEVCLVSDLNFPGRYFLRFFYKTTQCLNKTLPNNQPMNPALARKNSKVRLRNLNVNIQKKRRNYWLKSKPNCKLNYTRI